MAKTNEEFQALLHVVQARLDAGPKDAIEWTRIAEQLGEAKAYAEKCARLRGKLEAEKAKVST